MPGGEQATKSTMAASEAKNAERAPPATASFHRFRRIDQLIQAERKGQPSIDAATAPTAGKSRAGGLGGIQAPVSLRRNKLRAPCAGNALATEGLEKIRAQEDSSQLSKHQALADTKRNEPEQARQTQSQRHASVQTSPPRHSTSAHSRTRATEPDVVIRGDFSRETYGDKSAAGVEKHACFPARPFVLELANPSSLDHRAATPFLSSRMTSAELSTPVPSGEDSLFADLETFGLAPFRIQLGRQQDIMVELIPPAATPETVAGTLVIDLRAAGARGKGEVYVFESGGAKLIYDEVRFASTGSPREDCELSIPLRSRITVFSDAPQPTYAVSISPSAAVNSSDFLDVVLDVHVSPARDQCRIRLGSRKLRSATAESANDELDQLCLILPRPPFATSNDELRQVDEWLDARSQTSASIPPALRRSFLVLARYWISLEAQAHVRSISSAHVAARRPADFGQPQTFAIKPHAPDAGPSRERQLSRLLTSAAGLDACDTHHRFHPPSPANLERPRSPDRRCLPGLGWILRTANGDDRHVRYTALFADGRELQVLTARDVAPAAALLIDAKGRRFSLSRPEDLPKGIRKRLPFLAEMLLLFEV
ncbi:hypothetical protein BMF94_1924 [Rhodotorula taiwanensis]|uniref:Uncharacterized protein n=1 Tax=Rhodotorula taiwanensis TaxID=741276 RepID=A0A2S5BDW0_9BASI|nr:hypothetical protein BMF94_1924 [Rhodotorula taiwanensis]